MKRTSSAFRLIMGVQFAFHLWLGFPPSHAPIITCFVLLASHNGSRRELKLARHAKVRPSWFVCPKEIHWHGGQSPKHKCTVLFIKKRVVRGKAVIRTLWRHMCKSIASLSRSTVFAAVQI